MTPIISVGSRIAEVTAPALFFDGDSPVPTPVTLRFDDAASRLRLEGSEAADWPFADIRAIRNQAGGDQMILRLKGNATTRLLLTDPEARRLMATRARDLHRRPPAQRVGRLVGWAVAAIASVVLIVTVLVPLMADQLADYLPPEGERALGEATLGQIRTVLSDNDFGDLPICEDPAGLAALAVIEDRLTSATGLETELTVTVLDHSMVNAFALPGGFIVFFDGLLQEAERAEEVAAVYAHEIGHVVARDPTRGALRSAGSIGVLGLLLGDFAGGIVVLFLVEQIIEADYSQEAEALADDFAHDMLLGADLPPDAIATLFERLSAQTGEAPEIVQHFRAHPEMGDRIAAAREATPGAATFAPLLSEAQWADLQGICD